LRLKIHVCNQLADSAQTIQPVSPRLLMFAGFDAIDQPLHSDQRRWPPSLQGALRRGIGTLSELAGWFQCSLLFTFRRSLTGELRVTIV
jgi:hypothetical protein